MPATSADVRYIVDDSNEQYVGNDMDRKEKREKEAEMQAVFFVGAE